MHKDNLIILWLSIQLTVLGLLYVKAVRQEAYLQGRQSVWQEISELQADGPYEGKHGR